MSYMLRFMIEKYLLSNYIDSLRKKITSKNYYASLLRLKILSELVRKITINPYKWDELEESIPFVFI